MKFGQIKPFDNIYPSSEPGIPKVKKVEEIIDREPNQEDDRKLKKRKDSNEIEGKEMGKGDKLDITG